MEQELTKKEIEEILEEISKKMIVTYSVYYDEMKRSQQKDATKIVTQEKKASQQLLRDIKVCLLCPEYANAGTKTLILPMVQKLENNFSWAFWHYDTCILRTGYKPYIEDVQQQKEKFNGYFESLKKLSAKRDAENAPKEKQAEPSKKL